MQIKNLPLWLYAGIRADSGDFATKALESCYACCGTLSGQLGMEMHGNKKRCCPASGCAPTNPVFVSTKPW
jgi:hypothetical protein